jgi:hypothetical protein
MANLAARPPAVDYRLTQHGADITISAFLGDRLIATDQQPAIACRPDRPADLMRIVATFHLKALHAIANGDEAKRQHLNRTIPIGTVTCPDGSTL